MKHKEENRRLILSLSHVEPPLHARVGRPRKSAIALLSPAIRDKLKEEILEGVLSTESPKFIAGKVGPRGFEPRFPPNSVALVRVMFVRKGGNSFPLNHWTTGPIHASLALVYQATVAL